MRRSQRYSLLLGTCLTVLLSGCGGSSGIRVTEGDTQIGSPKAGTIVASNSASVVHVDLFERIATIRNGNQLPTGFLVAKNRTGEQTAALKARPARAEMLRTADILEGEPSINDIISPANSSESARLGKIYRDAEAE
ncbi:MAG TPA: hypothetical protein DCX06_01275 [Opitutae bacterium]|nr:hypothetical protein [Opitutae bacterium]